MIGRMIPRKPLATLLAVLVLGFVGCEYRPVETPPPSDSESKVQVWQGGNQQFVPLEPVDPSKVIVRLAMPGSRTLEQIADSFDLEIVETIGLRHAVLQGVYTVSALVADPDIQAASPNNGVGTAGNDYTFGFYEGEWTPGRHSQALEHLSLSKLHELGTGNRVRILVGDTGVDSSHPLLANNLQLLEPAIHVLGSVEPPPDNPAAAPAFGHGTHVAGCVLRVAPDATIVPVRILDYNGTGSLQDFVRFLVLALNPELHINIINLSMSTSNNVTVVNRLLNDLEQRGIVVVAAAGNYDYKNVSIAPPPSPLATRPNVVGVIAVDGVDVLAPFSRFGMNLRLGAPGVDIESAYPGYGQMPPGVTTGSGTSFAAPLVAGSIATIMEIGGMVPTEALNALIENAKSVVPTTSCMYGRIDPFRTARGLVPQGPLHTQLR